MRTMALITASLLLAFLLNLPGVGVSGERVAHYGLMVENEGGPEVCIVCHDGVLAPDAHYCTVECGFRGAHSILKEYPPKTGVSDYASVESLREKGIRLSGGKVSCVSCHDLRKSTEYHLIMENKGSALCFACHLI